MYKILGTFIVLSFLLYISGCGTDDTQVVEEDVSVRFVSVRLPNSLEISANAWITLRFDGIPTEVTTNVGD
ncbi:MAG: hypothetical protein OXU36_07850 [Candidatus Poribacteria bacterium]|nr:hypothetical protein [Candidatus Poribacteria bacterium]